MIKKLQIRFIMLATLIVTTILFVIISALNIHNYNEINDNSDNIINAIYNNKNIYSKPHDNQDMPFKIRYFIVEMVGGEVSNVRLEKIAHINYEEAIALTKEVDKTSGKLEWYRYNVIEDGDTLTYIFLDCYMEYETYQAFLKSSIIISLSGLVVFIVLIVLLSFVITKPISQNYRLQKRFITDASHELKTPLTIINATCDCLEIESGKNEYIESIKSQVNSLTELTNNLVFLSKMDEEKPKIIKSEFNLAEVTLECCQAYNVAFEAKGIKFDYDVSKNISINGDSSLIRSLINQLLENALKYTIDGGVCHLECTQNGRVKSIVIKNEIDPSELSDEDVKYIFERFYRIDKSRNSKIKGHGIGLSVAKAICDIHQATISCIKNQNMIYFNILF